MPSTEAVASSPPTVCPWPRQSSVYDEVGPHDDATEDRGGVALAEALRYSQVP
jgi:hypothetical protein